MKKLIQILLIVWFVVAGGLVLISGISLIVASNGSGPDVPAPPELPSCPTPDCKDVKAVQDALAVYTAKIAAYEKQLAAIKARADASKSPALDTYRAVAKETLQPLLNTILAALLGYVFVRSAATLVNNQLLMRANQQPERLDLP